MQHLISPFNVHRKIGGPDSSSSFRGELQSVSYKLGGVENITVEVNNVLVNKELHNVFGVIKGFVDPGTANTICEEFVQLLQ